tara:strand:- start:499 stop:1512 length:1014 start_codon:yes stop_codon:yes gene_type:complete
MRNHFLRAASAPSVASTGIITDDLFIHYDFGDLNSWNRTNGNNQDDYTIYNLANNHNNALLRYGSDPIISTSLSGTGNNQFFQFSSYGGGSLLLNGFNKGSGEQGGVIIPGDFSIGFPFDIFYNIPTVSSTSNDNLFKDLNTTNASSSFTIETWVRFWSTNFGGSSIIFLFSNNTPYSDWRTFSFTFWNNGQSSSNASRNKKLRSYNTDVNAPTLYDLVGTPSGSGFEQIPWNHIVYTREINVTSSPLNQIHTSKIYLNGAIESTVNSEFNLNTDIEGINDYLYNHMRYGMLGYMSGSGFNNPLMYRTIFRFYKGKALDANEVKHNFDVEKGRHGLS